jgi:hypothetical protein
VRVGSVCQHLTFAITNLIAFAVLFTITPAPSHAQDVFSELNLETPGLAAVRFAVDRKDFKSAESELLKYFRTRTNRTFNRFMLQGDSAKVYQLIRNKIFLRDQLVDFGSTIDWKKTGLDREWNYSLNRMGWLVDYASVYDRHPDERIVQAFMNQVRSWIQNAGGPGFPRTIDTGNRLYYWCIAHWYFIQHSNISAITPEFNIEMLRSMAAQAEFLYAPEHWRRFSNWGTFENSGLAYFAIMFPEFKRSQEWVNEIRFRMHFQLSNSYFDDGFHTEASPSYHAEELKVLFGIVRAAEDNRISLGLSSQVPIPSVRTLIRKPAEALMFMLQPNGTTPNVGDSDEETERSLLGELSEYLGSEDMRFVASAGQLGSVPSLTSAAFQKAGYYVMRSGWGSNDRAMEKEMYLLFDNGLNKPWHAHFDQLNIVAYANGDPLLRDAGRFTYNEDSDRRYFKGTAAHNTVVIDSLDQQADNAPAPARWIATRGYDFVAGVNTSPGNVTQSRAVLFVKPEYWIVTDHMSGEGSHHYAQFWHLDASVSEHLRYDPNTNQIQTPAMVLASPVTEARYTVGEGWFSPRYRERVKAPLLKRSLTSEGSLTWSTIILPKRDSSPRVTVERISASTVGDGKQIPALKIIRGTEADYFVDQRISHAKVALGNLTTDGSVLFARKMRDGALPAFFLANGSFIVTEKDTIVLFSHVVESASLVDGELCVETLLPVDVTARGDHIQTVRVNQTIVEFDRKHHRIQYEGDRLRR